MPDKFRNFVRDHANDELHELLFNASRYPDVDVKAAVVQIKARKRIKEKWPSWYNHADLIYPSLLSVEQCSSEITALYKQRLVQNDDWLCDLTGGLGIDAFFFSKKVKRVTFVERNQVCCSAAKANFQALGVENVDFIPADSFDFLKDNDNHLENIHVFYLDPSRRAGGNKRLYAIADCEPDLMKIINFLPKRYRLIVKLSPMLDVKWAVNQIPNVREVHILSIKNECKELLVISSPPLIAITDDQPLDVYCINYTTDGMEQSFRFQLSDELTSDRRIAKGVDRFLYEPHASILKAGAFKTIASRYGIEKLHVNSHLYTSDRMITLFPGRLFEVTDVFSFNSRMCRNLALSIPQATISVRHFPLSADELRKRMRINDGGDIYLFATTLSQGQKVLIKCQRINV